MPPFLTIEQVAQRLHVSQWTARKWAREGKLPARRIGRRWLVDLMSLRRKENS